MSLLTFAHLFTDSKLCQIWGINLRDQTDGIVLLLYEVKQIPMLSACEEVIFVHRTLLIILANFIKPCIHQ